LRRHADRVTALLRHRRVIDDEEGAGTNQPVGLLQQRSFKRGAVPYSRCDEMMKLIVAGFAAPGPPSAARSCDPQDLSNQRCTADTSCAVPDALTCQSSATLRSPMLHQRNRAATIPAR
jgi:hypothetical protein